MSGDDKRTRAPVAHKTMSVNGLKVGDTVTVVVAPTYIKRSIVSPDRLRVVGWHGHWDCPNKRGAQYCGCPSLTEAEALEQGLEYTRW